MSATDDLIAELRFQVEQSRRQARGLRTVIAAVLRYYQLADEVRELSDERLRAMGMDAVEVAQLRDAITVLRNFSWVGDYRVAGCARPQKREGIAALVGEGISTVVTLTEDALPEEWVEGSDIHVEHVPMSDLLPATVDQLERAVAAIEGGLVDSGAVAVHCAAGIGRTGTVLAAFLVARGRTAEAAIEALHELRPSSEVSIENRRVLAQYAAAHPGRS